MYAPLGNHHTDSIKYESDSDSDILMKSLMKLLLKLLNVIQMIVIINIKMKQMIHIMDITAIAAPIVITLTGLVLPMILIILKLLTALKLLTTLKLLKDLTIITDRITNTIKK